jgi:sterol desaturase/sphingolipid hydroxylase (fatty acid hydroxylase superfamily)
MLVAAEPTTERGRIRRPLKKQSSHVPSAPYRRTQTMLWSIQPPYSVSTMTAIIYFGEIAFTAILAIILLATSTLKVGDATVLFFCGVVALTLAEYTIHRFLLHDVAPRQHRIHHAHPQDPIDKIFWQIWVGFAVVYLMTGGVVLAGALVAYAWYLFVHYCAHHNPSALPPFLLKHHRDHHRFANRNYGVTTTLWDNVFRTLLR